MAKNITLAIDEDLLDKARILAAMRRTSVNEMVRSYLARLVEEERLGDEARSELLCLIEQSDGDMGSWRPSRRDTYDGEARFNQTSSKDSPINEE